MGRKRIEINRYQFEYLCGLQCTCEEIAGFFNCSVDTIERFCEREYKMRFAEVFKIKRQSGRISLRRHQFKLAERYPQMAIWLGKQYLNQTDKQEITIAEIDDETRAEIEDFLGDCGTNCDSNEITE